VPSTPPAWRRQAAISARLIRRHAEDQPVAQQPLLFRPRWPVAASRCNSVKIQFASLFCDPTQRKHIVTRRLVRIRFCIVVGQIIDPLSQCDELIRTCRPCARGCTGSRGRCSAAVIAVECKARWRRGKQCSAGVVALGVKLYYRAAAAQTTGSGTNGRHRCGGAGTIDLVHRSRSHARLEAVDKVRAGRRRYLYQQTPAFLC
jgi:hypothetical protein